LDDDVEAPGVLQEYEAKIAPLERMVGRQALEIEMLKLKGALQHAPPPRSANASVIAGAWGLSQPRVRTDELFFFVMPCLSPWLPVRFCPDQGNL
jgi:hypothetical protein